MRASFTRTSSIAGIPSVMQQISSIPASAASMIASAANGGGTKIIVAFAPDRSRANELAQARPIEWFERRQVGDILTRFSSIVPIQQALTQNTITALLDGVFALTLLAIMFFYSVALTVFTLLALMLYLLVRAVTYRPQRDLQEQVLIARAREQSSLIEAVRGIATLRLFGKESARHAAWSGLLIDSTNADIRYSRVGIFQSTTNVAVFTLEAVATVWLAVGLVIEGSFTTGMVFAFLAYKIQFVARATSFVDQAIIFKMLSLHLERLADIALAEEDDAFKEQASAIERCPRGRLELENVVFRYSPAEPLILDGASLRIECGEHVAITGASGSGKTTLMKVMLGLAHIQGGEIIVDGESLERFGIRNYRSGIAAVMQNDTLFSGSLASNIALFDEQVDQERLLRAAENASILEDILRMPMRFETLVGDMGSTLSGGQKQRVLLARALYRDPKILFMDEGTAHLDVALEREVSSKIAAMGITRIIVAHRPDTVRAADRVLRVENGRVYPVSSAEVQHASTGIAASGG